MTSQLENKSTIAKNGDAAGDGKNQTIDIGITEILLGYAIKNPIGTLSSCAMIFGGLLLLIYFINIQFLPDITLESAISILYSISFLGSLFIAMFAIFMAIPILISKIIWEDY